MPNNDKHYHTLPKGYCLEHYRIIKVLGAGGFGIAYLAEDTKLETEVVLKEYLPESISVREQTTSRILPRDPSCKQSYEKGLQRYIQEARTIAKFDHPNIVQVKNYIEANNTAYIVMNYVHGSNLADLAKGETATEQEIYRILFPLLDGLKEVHEHGFLHRDIKPANIFIQEKTRKPVLIDFGTARDYSKDGKKSTVAIYSAGYAPFEQYSVDSKKGAWTDIYAMGAVLYRLISGYNPPESTARVTATMQGEDDPLIPATRIGKQHYNPTLLKAIDHALALMPKQRPQSIVEWLAELEGEKAIPELTPPIPHKKSINKKAPKIRQLNKPDTRKTPEKKQTTNNNDQARSALNNYIMAITFGISIFVLFILIFLLSGSKDIDPKMVKIPAGSFSMGCISNDDDCFDDEKPVHTVNIKAFSLAETEVTFDQWQACVDDGGCQSNPKPDDEGWGRGKHPVINVSWDDTQEYIQWLNKKTGKHYRLPTEAEWEYAARAGTTTKYWWGNQAPSCSKNDKNGASHDVGENSDCYYKSNDKYRGTELVASYTANPWGLYDTAGNVWEWVEDRHHDDYKNAPTDGAAWNAGDSSNRVIRGGSWFSYPRNLRSAVRFRFTPDDRSNSLGFRLAAGQD